MMTINVGWVNSERTVVKWEFPSVWTWSDLHEAKQHSEAMLDQVSHSCALLLMLPSNAKIPTNALSNVQRILNDRHPRVTLFMVVTPNMFVHTVTDMVKKISRDMRERFQVVDTIEQACEALMASGYLSAEDRIGT